MSTAFILLSNLHTTPASASGRDPLLQPFASSSIWNTPIGSSAVYKAAGIQAADYVNQDIGYFYNVNTTPSHTYSLYSPDGSSYTSGGITYQGRCTGTTYYGTLQFPDNAVVGDATLSPNYSTPNNMSAIVQSDGRTLEEIQPIARCSAGANVHGYRPTESDIYGDGTYGAHFGSGLNGIGGIIRQGELTGSGPVDHALQLELWGQKYYSYNASSPTPGFRWPGDREDGYAKNSSGGYCSLDPCLSNPNTSLVEGSLLAMSASATESSLGLTTAAGKKIFHALQDFGGYTVDDTGYNEHAIGVETNAQNDVNWGDSSFQNDLETIFQHLYVIDNNSPTSTGGGGTPRVTPPAPLSPPAGPTPLNRSGWTASATYNSGNANLMLDNSLTTGWRSGQPLSSGENVVIDMKTAQTFNRITMDSSAYPYDHVQDFDLTVSNDGSTWSSLVVHGSDARTSEFTFATQTARYIKIQSTSGGINPAQTWSMDDFNVYNTAITGTPTPTPTNTPTATPGSGGSLVGSTAAASTGTYNLTSLGTTDWVHWGNGGYPGQDRKSGGSAISSVSTFGSGAATGTWHDSSRNYSWSNGTPTASATNNQSYIWDNGNTNTGFSFTVPADATSRTLTVYAGGPNGGVSGTLQASLSDNSATAYSSSFGPTGSSMLTNVYTVTYQAASAGQTLTITLTKTAGSSGGPSVDLIAAALSTSGGGSGSLNGSQAAAGSSYNLTSVGTSDWAHWGRGGTYGNFDHKSAGGSQISNVTTVGSGGNYGGYTDASRSVSWTDGTPTSNLATGDNGYIWSNGSANTGFSFTVPASTTQHTLVIYAGGYGSFSKLTAHLSDGSAADVTLTASGTGIYSQVYTITFKAASAGQTLTITLLKTGEDGGSGGSADLDAAWLS